MPGDFIDTNVLVYVASDDASKAEQVQAFVDAGGVISVQVLNELANIARRKMGLSWPETRTLLSLFRDLLDARELTVEIHQLGLILAERHQLSIYDAMIVASALEAGCDRLLSEDMHDGLLVEGRLRVVNPFRPSAVE